MQKQIMQEIMQNNASLPLSVSLTLLSMVETTGVDVAALSTRNSSKSSSRVSSAGSNVMFGPWTESNGTFKKHNY